MSDRELRELERAAAAGDIDAGARVLAARLRLGTLTEARLAMAAYSGDPAARQLVSSMRPICNCAMGGRTHGRGCELAGKAVAETPTALRIPPPLWKWIRHLPLERPLLARAAMALAFLVDVPAGAGALIEDWFDPITQWLECPCSEHSRPLRRANAETLVQALHRRSGIDWKALSALIDVVRRSSLAVVAIVSPDPGSMLTPLADLGATLVKSRKVREEQIRQAILDAIVPWALGPASEDESEEDALTTIRTGAELELVRSELGIFPAELCRALMVPPHQLARIERGGERLFPELARRLERFLVIGNLLDKAAHLLGRERRGRRSRARRARNTPS